ncbi:MAG: hypothetical protein JW983_02335 [Elusimicrobia bacterium]|nr:hypothetical protein [Elusimicrobiota bacterium]
MQILILLLVLLLNGCASIEPTVRIDNDARIKNYKMIEVPFVVNSTHIDKGYPICDELTKHLKEKLAEGGFNFYDGKSKGPVLVIKGSLDYFQNTGLDAISDLSQASNVSFELYDKSSNIKLGKIIIIADNVMGKNRWKATAQSVVTELKKRIQKEEYLPPTEIKTTKVSKKVDGTENIAVLNLEARNVSEQDAATISDLIRTALVNVGFSVIDKANMDKILEEHKFQRAGVTSPKNAAEIGKILNAQKIVVGSFSKLMDSYYITINLVDVETAQIVNAESVKSGADQDFQYIANVIAKRLVVK